MHGDRLFYVMIVVIALIGVGLFAIPVRAGLPEVPVAERNVTLALQDQGK